MPDLESFEAEVKAKIKQLNGKDPDARRKAAIWLGEAGEPTAITALVTAYRSDSDPRVKEAARYSLGMFRALERALDEDPDKTVKLLEDIALRGRMGRRRRIGTRGLVKLMIGLLISALAVAALAFVLPPMLRGAGRSASGAATPVPAPAADRDRATLVGDLSAALNTLSENTAKLQAQYQGVLGGGDLTCSEAFAALDAVQLSANDASNFADLATIAGQINDAQTSFQTAKTTFDQVCGGQQLERSAYGAPMQQVIALTQSIDGIRTALTGDAPPADAATPTPEAAVEPTPETSVLRTTVSELQAIIDDVYAVRGAYTLLNVYWTEASTTGTGGCTAQISIDQIPANYELAADLQSNGDLSLTVNLVNTGLQFLRQGWEQFASACARNETAIQSLSGLQAAAAAKTAFDSANTQLSLLRGP
jgi:hypothetical protein